MKDTDTIDDLLAEFQSAARTGDGFEDGVGVFSIRDLCEAFDVTPRALRFYETQGLIAPKRDGQRRVYSQKDRARLFLVLRGKRFGFSLAEIRELLELYDRDDRQRSQIEAAIVSGEVKLRTLYERRRDLDEAIAELEKIMKSLNAAAQELDANPAVADGPKKRVFGEPKESQR